MTMQGWLPPGMAKGMREEDSRTWLPCRPLDLCQVRHGSQSWPLYSQSGVRRSPN